MDFDINTAIDTLTKQRDDLVNNTTKKKINKINKKITIFKLTAKKYYESINNNSTIDDINHVIEQLNYYNDLIKSNTERLNELKETISKIDDSSFIIVNDTRIVQNGYIK